MRVTTTKSKSDESFYINYAFIKGKEDTHEGKIFCETDLREMQGYQEKRQYSYHL